MGADGLRSGAGLGRLRFPGEHPQHRTPEPLDPLLEAFAQDRAAKALIPLAQLIEDCRGAAGPPIRLAATFNRPRTSSLAGSTTMS